MRLPRLTVLPALVALGLLPGLIAPASATPPGVPSSAASAATASVLTDRHGDPVVARKALERVQDVLKPKSHAEAQDRLKSGRDATMDMRDLWLHRDALSRSQQATAARAMARPSLPLRVCNAAVCVHYVKGGSNGSTDGYARTVLNTVTHVYGVYKRAGYRRPVPDGTAGGGNNLVDIYLQDVAHLGYYGYCAPERTPPGQPRGSHIATSYCVLDNDYSPNQYGNYHSPLQNLQVTAAHEFFHAVQFAYDAADDRWFMEATATWAEDQLYTKINDNLQYLPFGQLHHPGMPLDKPTTYGIYGNWIFFRFLSEHVGRNVGGLPVIIRRIWEAADSSRGKRHDRYSVWAISVALRHAHRPLKTMYAAFAEANHRSRTAYREGKANHYPVAPVNGGVTLRRGKKRAHGSFTINHLSSSAERFAPRKLGRRAHLRVNVDLTSKRTGAALLTIFFRDGSTRTRWVRLNRAGNGHASVPFSSSRVGNVVLTLVNSGHSYNCWQKAAYSCRGVPKQDHLHDSWSVKVG